MVAHLLFAIAQSQIKKAKEPPSQRTKSVVKWTDKSTTDKEALLVTRYIKNWGLVGYLSVLPRIKVGVS